MTRVEENLDRVLERIERAAGRSGRSREAVRLVAVTKNVDVERIKQALDAGVTNLGENYVQEARDKTEALGIFARWHMIGHLQSNKARAAVEVFHVVETVDRERILKELNRHAGEAGKMISVMIQVNLSGEPTRSGVLEAQVPDLLQRAAACRNLRCLGLMTLAPFDDDPEKARPYFARLRVLRDGLRSACPEGVQLDALSMGMSADFEVAIEEGATHVRIGTAIFGERQRAR